MSDAVERAAEIISEAEHGYPFDGHVECGEAAQALAAARLLVTDEIQAVLAAAARFRDRPRPMPGERSAAALLDEAVDAYLASGPS